MGLHEKDAKGGFAPLAVDEETTVACLVWARVAPGAMTQAHSALVVVRAETLWQASAYKGRSLFRRRATGMEYRLPRGVSWGLASREPQGSRGRLGQAVWNSA